VIELKLCITHCVIHIYYELRCEGWETTRPSKVRLAGGISQPCNCLEYSAPFSDVTRCCKRRQRSMGRFRFLRLDGGHRHQTD
jgi:hypothetical protein